ncbi:MAG: hypothetical protein VKI83_07140, partial [Synechococcaceae cyanobacterium]|nr:hypothetical protein [Synechococcaceae cyanobacterium]
MVSGSSPGNRTTIQPVLPQSPLPADRAQALLEELDRSIEAVILRRQHPVSGLLPASTASTVHGNYGDAWVRD